MGLYISGNNSVSLAGVRALSNSTRSLNTSLSRLASGMRLNRAADGPADWAVAESLTSQVRGLGVAEKNVQQGIAMLNTADAGLQTITAHLQRLNEISIEAQNAGANNASLQAEATSIMTAIDNIANNTKFGSVNLLDGSAGAKVIQAGANAGDDITLAAGAFGDVTSATLTLATGVASAANAATFQGEVQAAMTTITTQLAAVGSAQIQMENQLNTIGIQRENFSSAETSVRGADIAAESANLTRQQILQQAAAAALAQANQMPSIALKLLQ